MHVTRIAELLDPYISPANDRRLTAGDLAHISTYIDLLLRWNARINLTAIRDPEQIVTRHFGESLFAARRLFDRSGSPLSVPSAATENHVGTAAPGRPGSAINPTLADLGSGAGFPGIPIKLWAPNVSVTLIESNQKKATFLGEVARSITLTAINIQNARAETLPAAGFATVTLRAVERFESILPVAARLVAPGGRLALLIGTSQLPQAQSALPSFAWQQPDSVPNSQARILAIASRTI